MSASPRSSLEALPLLASIEIRGIGVRRTALLTYRLGDLEHDLDGAEAVLEGLLPLRPATLSLGRWSEVWLLVDGGRAGARVQQLRAALGSQNVRQDRIDPPNFSRGAVPKFALLITPPSGVAIPPVKPKSISSNFWKLGVDEQDMNSCSLGAA